MEDVSEDGVLAYHISNRYFDLRKPLGAAAAHLGHRAFYIYDEPAMGAAAHEVAILALVVVRNGQMPDFLQDPDTRWEEIKVDPAHAWTDDRSSPFTSLK